MPEYLSPGVYVEEIELLPRPISGVSTSTTAFVGVTKRGPVNRPTLVTNIDEYQRLFAEYLDQRTYGDNRFVPYAVQGFFANGGQRAYILRIANPPATPLSGRPDELYERYATTDRDNVSLVAFLELPARGGSQHRQLGRDVKAGDAAIDLGDWSGLEVGDALRVGELAVGAEEYARITGFTNRVLVDPPFGRDHDAGTPVRVLPDPTPSPAPTAALATPTANAQGATTIRVAERAGLANGDWLSIGGGPSTDFARIGAALPPNAAGPGAATVDPALARNHPPVPSSTSPADPVLPYRAPAAAVTGQLQGAHGPGQNNAGELTLPDTAIGFTAGDIVHVAGPGNATATDREEVVRLGTRQTVGATHVYTLTPPLRFNHPDQAAVTKLERTATGPTTLAPPDAIALDDTTDFAQGDVVLLDDQDRREVVSLGALPGGNAPFLVQTSPPPRHHHASNVDVEKVANAVPTGITFAQAANQSSDQIRLSDVTGLPRGSVIQILSGARTEHAHIWEQRKAQNTNAGDVRLMRALEFPHASGTPVVELTPAIRIVAGPARPSPDIWPEPGVWGNGIRVTVGAASIARTTLKFPAAAGNNFIDVVASPGIERGTILRFPGNTYARVDSVAGNRVFLANPGVPQGVSVTQEQADAADPFVAGVQTVEFKLSFSYGPVVQILDESFDNLSMDPDHSRYFERVINGDSPAERASLLVHLEDLTDRNAAPATPTDRLPLLGTFYPGGGSDGLAGIAPSLFVGRDSDDADRRTGLSALLNASGISIATIPGQTSFDVQSALVTHCERHKYTFAVLDARRGSGLDDIQLQRSLFDSTYGALYYPWLEVFDVFEQRSAFVPPSGHVAGIYARTDGEVGVHKAPANAVVTQARDLERTITKAQQDVLNPKGINAIRAFPGRGILVWGARTISTTNPLWRYVNVRRLFIFLEESIDLSTQYAPFQINDVPLWNRLKASVRAFLLVVWRSGALQGATEDEAFFVRCGLGETMIQQDIDEGRVIVVVGAAPVKPAEFVIFRIAQTVPGFEA
jgi:uncharacterized protein